MRLIFKCFYGRLVFLCLVCLTLTLAGCYQHNSHKTAKEETKSAKPKETSSVSKGVVKKMAPARDSAYDPYQNIVDPMTLSNSSKLYARQDTNSTVLKTLNFGTPLKIIGINEDYKELVKDTINKKTGEKYQYRYYSGLVWCYVRVQGMEGAIKATDVSTHTFSVHNKNINFLYLLTNGNPTHHTTPDKLKILKYDYTTRRFVDSLEVDQMGTDIARQIDHSGWKNVDMLFSVTKIDAFCGGDNSDIFIADANGKLQELISRDDSADDGSGDSYNATVWLPVKNSEGSVKLVTNGDIDGLSKHNRIAEITEFKLPIPKRITFPISEMIVKSETESKSIYDKNNEPEMNKDGSYKSKIIKDKVHFYRWNGSSLVKID